MLKQVHLATAPIDDYTAIIGVEEIERLRTLAARLSGARIVHVNATPYGGGVSELLRSSIALQRGLGIDVEWRIISGDTEFFEVTKGLHNALQGGSYDLTREAEATFLVQNSFNAREFENHYDFVIVHDPQPVALLPMHGRGGAKWVWRCHIDTSHPNPAVLGFLLPFISEYDGLVFTLESFVPEQLRNHRRHIIPPAIDPLSPKNFPLPEDLCRRTMAWVGVDPDRPLLTQVSRFDPWKDPLGVIEIYRAAREAVPNLQLALLGSMALDDPEAWSLMEQIQAEAAGDDGITVATNLTGIGNTEVNAFQRGSDVVIQKSIREGFGLVVSEALWKGTPVVAGNTGGIPLQLPHGSGGYLVDPYDDTSFVQHVVQLLQDDELAIRLGMQGRQVVRDGFLINRLIADELSLLCELAAV